MAPIPVGTGGSLVPVNAGSLPFWLSTPRALGHGVGPRLQPCLAAVDGLQSQLVLLGALVGNVLPDFSFELGLARSEPSPIPCQGREVPRHITSHLAGTTLSLFEAQPSRETGVKAVWSPQKE